jgi:hypothetical protein
MSRRAEMLVWERSRAKGSNLLVLLVLADCAQHDGRDAFPSVKYLAQHARLTVRGVRFVLAKLHADGEIVTEENVTDRPMTAGARQVIPPWFIHVRCVCDWPAYRGKDFPDSDGKDFPADGKDFPDGGKPATALYKEEILEQEDPRTEIQELAAVPALHADGTVEPERAFATLWNESTTAPILPCVQLTAQRRRHIRKRLSERPLTQWVEVFKRIQASAFCRGDNDRGWVADFAWIIGSADVAVKVLEGKYDTRVGRERPFTATELADARRVRDVWMGCSHDPRCASFNACLAAIVRQARRERGEAA